MNFALMEDGHVKSIVATDDPATHPARFHFRNIPQDGKPEAFIGMPAEALPNAPNLLEPVPEPAKPEKVDRIYTESKTVRMPQPDPFDHPDRKLKAKRK